MNEKIVSQTDLLTCRQTSDKQFALLTKNLDNYHKKMDNHVSRLLVVTNGKRVERAPDDLLVEIWETIQLLRDMKRVVEIFKRWKKLAIGLGIVAFVMIGKWQIADLFSLLTKYHIIK